MAPRLTHSAAERAQERINRLLATPLSYITVAASYGVSTGTLWRMGHGIEPRADKARRAFGLPAALGPGTQYAAVRYCKVKGCHKPFIPNTPTRRRCFECRPVRRKSRRRYS
jgi:hypothetical protein